MRNHLACLFVLALLGTTLLAVGCNTAGAGVAGAREGLLSISATVNAGPTTSAARFAASVRSAEGDAGSPTARITRQYQGVVRVNGVPVSRTTSLEINSAQTRLTYNVDVAVVPGPVYFSLEVLPASNTSETDPLFMGYFRAVVGDSPTVPQLVVLDATSTARALSFEAWKKREGTRSRSIQDFTPDVGPLATLIQGQLDQAMASGTPLDQSFAWKGAVQQEIARIAAVTPVASEATGPSIATGTVELFLNAQWTMVAAPLPVDPTPGQVIGITYFYHPDVSRNTLGNYYRVFPRPGGQDATRVIALMPGVASLDEVSKVPTALLHHALESFPQPTELEIGQVYAFQINGSYGVLEITGIFPGTSITFRYKANRTAFDTALE